MSPIVIEVSHPPGAAQRRGVTRRGACSWGETGLCSALTPTFSSGRIHGELLQLLYLLTDKRTAQVYCWRRNEFFWHISVTIRTT